MRERRVRTIFGIVAFGMMLGAPAAAAQRDGSAPATTAPAGIVFVGSSIFHRWTALAQQMAPLPIINRAFDGALTFDMLRMMDSLVARPPKVVAYYCGSNDVDAGERADAIFDRIRQFIVRIRTASPPTRVLVVSINRAPEKQDRWDVVDEVNRRVQAFAAGTNGGVQYVDVNAALMNGDGSARLELFLPDQLHLRPAAYELFAGILKPVLTAAYTAP